MVHGTASFATTCASQPEVVIGRWRTNGAHHALTCDNLMPNYTLFANGKEIRSGKTPEEWFSEKYKFIIHQGLLCALALCVAAAIFLCLLFMVDGDSGELPLIVMWISFAIMMVSAVLGPVLLATGLSGRAFVRHSLQNLGLSDGDTDGP